METTDQTQKVLEQSFILFYQKVFPKVAQYIASKGGSLDETRDIFQDALVIYYENGLRKERIYQDGEAYLFGIARYLWYQRYRKKQVADLVNRYEVQLEHSDYTEIADQQILEVLKVSGQRCLELLKAFYYNKLSMAKLADRFGFSTERSATVQKFKCLEKVRDFVKQKTLQYEDFLE